MRRDCLSQKHPGETINQVLIVGLYTKRGYIDEFRFLEEGEEIRIRRGLSKKIMNSKSGITIACSRTQQSACPLMRERYEVFANSTNDDLVRRNCPNCSYTFKLKEFLLWETSSDKRCPSCNIELSSRIGKRKPLLFILKARRL